jgi:hypothetical protein
MMVSLFQLEPMFGGVFSALIILRNSGRTLKNSDQRGSTLRANGSRDQMEERDLISLGFHSVLDLEAVQEGYLP